MDNGMPDWRTTLISNEVAAEVLAEQEAASTEIAYERPGNGVFFRSHSTLHRPVFFLDRTVAGSPEHCLVMSEDVLKAHKTRCKQRHCFLYCKEDGGLGVWATSTLQNVAYCKTGIAAATAAIDGWVSIHSDNSKKKYRIHRPTPDKLDELKDPRWPTHFEDVAQAIMQALDDPERFVTGLEHPVVAGFGPEIQVELED
jgi:hypothetical protein